jgi:hypothetical protein
MSASVLRSTEFIRMAGETTVLPEASAVRATRGWNAEDFAREQIRGLVRQVFFSSADRPVRQVVFAAVESHDGVGDICGQIGAALASEAQGSIAVVTRQSHPSQKIDILGEEKADLRVSEKASTLRLAGTRVRGNLWLISENEIVLPDRQGVRRTSLYSHMGELRRDFEYSIIAGPPVAESSDAACLGQLADGIVLVLSERCTRRATARKIKQTLDATAIHILGSVLSDRTFPIPEGIYRRL